MAKDENSNGASSKNGSSPSAGGVSPNGAIDPEERASLDRIHEGYRELRKQIKAEGFDGTEEYEKLRARAATWSQ
jgi:hypothetical protein